MEKIKFLMLLSLWLLSMAATAAESRVDIIYDIKRGWVDEVYVYVMYDEVHMEVHSSVLKTEGVVTGQKKEIHLKRFKKPIAGGTEIDLRQEGEAVPVGDYYSSRSTRNFYMDDHITIRENNGLALVSIGGKNLQFKCDHKLWDEELIPVKWAGQYFYCGYIIQSNGEEAVRLPEKILSSLRKFNNKNRYGVLDRIDYVSDGDILLLAHNGENLGAVLKVDAKKLEAESIELPAPVNGKYRIRPQFSFTKKFYLGEKYVKPPVLFACNEAHCTSINEPSYSEYCVIDDEMGEAYFLGQERPVSSIIVIDKIRIH